MAYPGEKVYTIDGKKVPETVAYTNYRLKTMENGENPLPIDKWRAQQAKKSAKTTKTTKKSTGSKPSGGPDSTVLKPMGSTFGS